MIEQIRAVARQILADKTVDVVIGYEIGTRGATRPAFIYEAGDVDRLVWNDACTHNLANYVREKHVPPKRGAAPAKVGLVLKAWMPPRTQRAAAREPGAAADLYLIGVTCAGMRQNAGFANRQTGDLELRCQTCAERTPVVYDTLIGDPVAATPAVSDALAQELDRLAAMTPGERQAFWDAEFERCLRCYACRQACPALLLRGVHRRTTRSRLDGHRYPAGRKAHVPHDARVSPGRALCGL